MNVATVDKYGANSAIELLRHWIEFGRWYNLDDASVAHLIDMQVSRGRLCLHSLLK